MGAAKEEEEMATVGSGKHESAASNSEIESNDSPNQIAGRDEDAENKQLIKTSLITALAIGLHNFPEGLATFTASVHDPALGASLVFAIAIHNTGRSGRGDAHLLWNRKQMEGDSVG